MPSKGIGVTFASNLLSLLTGSADGRARLFDLQTGLMISVLELGAAVRAIDVLEDELLVTFALVNADEFPRLFAADL